MFTRCVARNSKILFKNTQNHTFFTSSRQHAIPPVIWLIVKPISKVAAMLVGRGMRAWWKEIRTRLTPNLVKEHLKRNRIRYFIGTSITYTGGFIFYETHLQVAPITGRKRFILFLPSQMDDVEMIAKQAMNEQYGDRVITKYTADVSRVLRVLNRLVDANQDVETIKKTKFTVTCIEDDIVNACVFPSGHVIVYTGLLKACANDDELGSILGHELSHAILQHSAENLSRSRIIDIISLCAVLTIWMICPSDIASLAVQSFSNKVFQFALEYPYSRFLEKEADEVGLELAAKACFDVRYVPHFWRRVDDSFPEYLSTHPSNENRSKELENLLPKMLQMREKCKCAKLPDKLTLPIEVKKVPKPQMTTI